MIAGVALAVLLFFILAGCVISTPRRHHATECRVLTDVERMRIYLARVREHVATVPSWIGGDSAEFARLRTEAAQDFDVRQARGQRVKDSWLAHMREKEAARNAAPRIEFKVSRLRPRRTISRA